jgi:hypothetical protein
MRSRCGFLAGADCEVVLKKLCGGSNWPAVWAILTEVGRGRDCTVGPGDGYARHRSGNVARDRGRALGWAGVGRSVSGLGGRFGENFCGAVGVLEIEEVADGLSSLWTLYRNGRDCHRQAVSAS